MNPELQAFVDKARQHDLPDDEIRQRLISAGWTTEAVAAALGSDTLEVPKPPQTAIAHKKQREDPRLLSNEDQRDKAFIFEYHM